MKIRQIFKEAFLHWKEKDAQRMGAALSYYAIFSIIPIALLLIVFGSMFFSKSVIEEGIIQSLIGSMRSNDSEMYIQSLLSNAPYSMGVWSTIMSLVTVIVGAISVFSELDKDLNQLWNAKPVVKKKTSLWAKVKIVFREKIIVFSIIPILGILLLISIASGVFFSLVQEKLNFHGIGLLLQFLGMVLSFVLSMLLFGFIYRVFPRTKLPWSEIWLGAVMTALLFFFGNIVSGLYLRFIGKVSTFGTAGSFVAILVWIYYSAQVFFLGASFTYIYSKHNGYLKKFQH